MLQRPVIAVAYAIGSKIYTTQWQFFFCSDIRSELHFCYFWEFIFEHKFRKFNNIFFLKLFSIQFLNFEPIPVAPGATPSWTYVAARMYISQMCKPKAIAVTIAVSKTLN